MTTEPPTVAEIIKRWQADPGAYPDGAASVLEELAVVAHKAPVYERARCGPTNRGTPLWRHTCGHVEAWTTEDLTEIKGGCDACESGSDDPTEWRALYLMRDA